MMPPHRPGRHGSKPTKCNSGSSLTPWLRAPGRARARSTVHVGGAQRRSRRRRSSACFSDTTAPPIRAPLQPAASIRRPAESPGGFVNTEPGVLTAGLVLAPPAHDLVDPAPHAPGSSRVPENVAATTTDAGRSVRAAVPEPELRPVDVPHAGSSAKSNDPRPDDHVSRSARRGRRRSSAPRRRPTRGCPT